MRPVKYLTVADLRAEKQGSLEDQLIALADYLRSLHVEPSFAFSAQPTQSVAARLRLAGAEIYTLPFRQARVLPRAFSTLLEQLRPDIAHFHFVSAYSILQPIARLLGSFVVAHEHMVQSGYLDPSLKGRIRRVRALLKRPIAEQTSLRIAVSNAVTESIAPVVSTRPERFSMIRNAVDTNRFRPRPELRQSVREELQIGSEPVVLTISRHAEEKGIDVLVEAMAMALRRDRPATLLIAGAGPGMHDTKRLVERLGLTARVRLLGLRDDGERLLNAADIAVMPSRCQESCSLLVLEAQSCGVPVVATNVGGVSEHVRDKHAGLLVPSENPRAMADAIDTLIDNAALREELGAAGRQRAVDEFSISRWRQSVVDEVATRLPNELRRRFEANARHDDHNRARASAS